jgi:hypothetical protein
MFREEIDVLTIDVAKILRDEILFILDVSFIIETTVIVLEKNVSVVIFIAVRDVAIRLRHVVFILLRLVPEILLA